MQAEGEYGIFYDFTATEYRIYCIICILGLNLCMQLVTISQWLVFFYLATINCASKPWGQTLLEVDEEIKKKYLQLFKAKFEVFCCIHLFESPLKFKEKY